MEISNWITGIVLFGCSLAALYAGYEESGKIAIAVWGGGLGFGFFVGGVSGIRIGRRIERGE